jgi:hypothetical protein
VVANVISGLFAGEDEGGIDLKAHDSAQNFKHQALPICKDVQSLKRIQDNIAAGVVAFSPHALIKNQEATNCQHDINSDN